MKIADFLPEFISELTEQLEQDNKKWGTTWLERSPKGQEERAFSTFSDYYDQFRYNNIPVPWLKIAGHALICWIREKHPEIWNKQNAS